MASTTAIALRSSLRHAASLDVAVRAKLSGTGDDGANHCSHITHAHSAWAVAVEVSRENAMSNGLRGSRMIQLPLLCISRRAASGRHLRRVLTRRCRVGLAHLILRNRCADGGARAGVRWPARMGLVGRDSQPKIAILQQGLFRIERLSDRGILSTLVALGTPRHGGMIAPRRSNSLRADFLMRAPHPHLSHTGLFHPLDPHVGVFDPVAGVGPAHHFPLPGESVMRSPIWSCAGKMRMVPGGSGGGMPGSGGWTGLAFCLGRGLATD